MNVSYIRVLNAFEAFASAHLQIKRFASDFPEQMPNFATEKETYPILFVSPSNTIFDENANQFTVTVYCFDIIEKDRSNINTILSDTNSILNDVYRWFKDGDIYGIDIVDNAPNVTPINNALLDYAAGWQMTITFSVDTYGICEIPFAEAPVVITEVCDVVYAPYLTCETLESCQAIVDIETAIDNLEDLALTQDQYDAINASNSPSAANPFATIADLTGGGESLAGTLAIGNTTSGNNIELSNNDYLIGNGAGAAYFNFGTNGGNINITTPTSSITKGAIAITAAKSLGLTFNIATVTDTSVSPKGLQYAADYSATYTNRSLVDKEYVDNLTPTPSDLEATLTVGNSTGNIDIVSPDGFSVASIQDNQVVVGYDNGTFSSVFAGLPLQARVQYYNGSDLAQLVLNASVTELNHTTAINLLAPEIVVSDDVTIYFGSSGSSTNIFGSDGLGYSEVLLNGRNDDGATYIHLGNIDLYNDPTSAYAQMFSRRVDIVDPTNNARVILTLDAYNGSATFQNDHALSRGLEYAADYSANYSNRSLVDKEYVDNAIPSTPPLATVLGVGASTGNIRITGPNLRAYLDVKGTTPGTEFTALGVTVSGANYYTGANNGTVLMSYFDGIDTSTFTIDSGAMDMNHFVRITGGAPSVTFTGANYVGLNSSTQLDLNVDNGIDVNTFHMFPAGETITGNGIDNAFVVTDAIFTKGIVYAADYSANFTDESLVTKRYVDSLTPPTPTLASVLVAGNTSSGTNVLVDGGSNIGINYATPTNWMTMAMDSFKGIAFTQTGDSFEERYKIVMGDGAVHGGRSWVAGSLYFISINDNFTFSPDGRDGFRVNTINATDQSSVSVLGYTNDSTRYAIKVKDQAGTILHSIRNDNQALFSTLAGTGTQMVTADINGVLSKQAIPTQAANVSATFDGQGGVISAGNYIRVYVPYNMTLSDFQISSYDALTGAAVSGSITIDVKRSGTTIIGAGNFPLLSSASMNSASLSGWTSVAVTAGDALDIYVSVAAVTCTKVTVTINGTKS